MQQDHAIHRNILRSVIAIAALCVPVSMHGQTPQLDEESISVPHRDADSPLNPLVSAIWNEGMEAMDSITVVYALRRQPGLVDSIDSDGRTLLHMIAAENFDDRENAIPMLVGHGARVDARDHDGRTPLFAAGTSAIARHLLELGADPRARDNNRATPLHFIRNPATIDLLVSKGIDIDARSLDGRTALHRHAGEADRESTVRQLISHGARVMIADGNGDTPLHIAVQSGDSATVALLLAAGADPAAANRLGHTPLHLAAYKNSDPGALRALLAARPSFEAHNRAGRTALEVAVEQRNNPVAVLLLDAGAAIPPILPPGENDVWRTPLLIIAATNGDAPIVDALVRHGADVNAREKYSGVTPLHVAASGDIAGYLLEKGAGRDTPDGTTSRFIERIGSIEGSMTPIETAVAYERDDVTIRLLEAGADPNAALETASMRRDPFWTAVLLRYGAVPTEESLMMARRFRNERVIKLLQERMKPAPRPVQRRR